MKQATSVWQRLVALGLLGILLLNFPLLGSAKGEWGGMPAGLAYVLLAWLFLIGAAAWLVRRERD